MDRSVEKLLYSRRDTAEALSLSIRSIDYLITTGRLTCATGRWQDSYSSKAVRRFAREDHPDSVRSEPGLADRMKWSASSEGSMSRFQPQSEEFDETVTRRVKGRH